MIALITSIILQLTTLVNPAQESANQNTSAQPTTETAATFGGTGQWVGE